MSDKPQIVGGQGRLRPIIKGRVLTLVKISCREAVSSGARKIREECAEAQAPVEHQLISIGEAPVNCAGRDLRDVPLLRSASPVTFEHGKHDGVTIGSVGLELTLIIDRKSKPEKSCESWRQ
jgi:hypothetical protein